MKNKICFFSFSTLCMLFMLISCSNIWNINKNARISFTITQNPSSESVSSSTPQLIDDDSELPLARVEIIDAVGNSVIASKSTMVVGNEVTIQFAELPIVGRTVFIKAEIIKEDSHLVGRSPAISVVDGDNYITIDELFIAVAYPIGKRLEYTGIGQVIQYDTFDESTMSLDTSNSIISASNVGSYPFTVTLHNPETHSWVDGTKEAKIARWYITKAQNSWEEDPDITGWEVGSSANAPTGRAEFGDIVYTYKAASGGSAFSSPPTAAGSYVLIATVVGTSNYDGLSHEVSFEVTGAASLFNYTDNGDGTLTVTEYTGSATSLVIPASIDGKAVTIIGNSAFNNLLYIESVVISEGIQEIYGFAFDDCSNLSSVTLPSTLTLIGGDAFGNLPKLLTLTIPINPNGVMEIKSGAFTNSTNLTITSMIEQSDTFSKWESGWNTDVKEVIWPSSGGGNATLTYVYHNSGGYYYVTGVDTTTGTDVVIPSTYNNGTNGVAAVKDIDDNVFTGNTIITSIVIPSSITEALPTYMFQGCTALETAIIDARSSNYLAANPIAGMFSGCTSLVEVTINAPIQSVGASTFNGCTSLKNFTIPSTVETIGSSAFVNSGITSIVIPDSVTRINGDAFSTSALTSVTLGTGELTIAENAFRDCTGLGTLYIPNTVVEIEDRAFTGASNLDFTSGYTSQPVAWGTNWDSGTASTLWQ